jgi:hypothetical protein
MATAFEIMAEWARQREDEYLAQGRALAAEVRGDEANLMRVRSNICGVFCALIRAAQRRATDLTELAENTSAPWKQRLALAQSHGDAVTAAIEQAKLETMALLLEEWKRTGGEQA